MNGLPTIPQKWHAPLWGGVFAVALFQLTVFVLATPYRIAELTSICTTPDCLPLQLTAADVAYLNEIGLSVLFYAWSDVAIEIAAVFVSMVLMALIFVRARHTWIGLVVALAVTPAGINIMNGWLANSGSLLVIPYLIVFSFRTAASFGMIAIFPDGRFYPKWSRLVAFLLLGVFIISSILAGDGSFSPFPFSDALSTTLLPAALLSNLAFFTGLQIYRYRTIYTVEQRQQTRLIIIAVAGLLVSVVVWFALFEVNTLEGNVLPHGQPFVLAILFINPIITAATVLFIPVAITVAILRYRLWNVDIIIRRTLQYGAVSAILAAVYFGTVVLLQSVFRGVVGAESPLVVVLSTLLIAALFNPVRGRVQRIVDRRFYRQRYDAEQILAAFSSAMRDEVALGQIERELLATVSTTLEPEYVSLWVMKENEHA